MQKRSRMSIGRAVGLVAVWTLMGTGAYAADKIGVTMPNIKGPWFTPVLFGVTDEAKKLNYDVIIQDAGGYGNVDKQVSQLSNLLVQKVKAILLDPANPDSFNGVVRQAKSDKIPVVGVGSPIVASNVEADGAASSSHCNIGHELAKGAKILLPNGGTLAILAGPPGAFWAAIVCAVSKRTSQVAILRSSPSRQASRMPPSRSRSPTTCCSAFRMSTYSMVRTTRTASVRHARRRVRRSVAR